MTNYFFQTIHNFMKVTREDGDKNVFSHLYPNVTFHNKGCFYYPNGYESRKVAYLYVCRVRYGYNGAGFTGYGKTADEAMTSVLEQIEVRLSQRDVNLAKKQLEKKYVSLFEEKLNVSKEC